MCSDDPHIICYILLLILHIFPGLLFNSNVEFIYIKNYKQNLLRINSRSICASGKRIELNEIDLNFRSLKV